MKRNKPTYISDLTTEILTSRDLLHQWAENSVDMEFLELSIETLSNIDLLDRWDCDNILNIKLAPILSGDLDYKLISGHVVYIEKGVGFPIKSSSYRKMVKLLIDKKEGYNLQKQDLLNQGYSLEVIERQERIIKMNNFLKAVEKTKNYTLNNISYYLENLIPEATKRHQKEKKELFKEKVDELLLPDNEKYVKTEAAAIESKKIKEEPNFNRNHWNEKCFDLFNYFIDNYEKNGKIKFINIFYFLKKNVDKSSYSFAFTIDQYKVFIASKYNVKLTKFQTAEYDFKDKEVPILNAFEANFRKQV
jgi:hypothetical protein